MKRFCFTAAAVILLQPGIFAGSPQNKPEKLEDVHAQAAHSSDADPNVTGEEATNSRSSKVTAPPEKGGPATRAIGVCAVHVDNATPWKIKSYVDGTYRGLVDSFGDGYTYTISGGTRLYARAEFDNGEVLTWGPSIVSCPSGSVFHWRLDN
jgi:hypothetical protein